ncbi:HAMP domain-containing histidine kinase [Catenulispora sp. NF23]|uniref:sensor histidine kinase n=1 Tax=Catenulispora pinistramenti TaxID=2705254 RepID=UPI001BA98402|nr:HAMP domain-containing sensor histidine kinase [Catenulispora pinistramenti]MBS2534097.1 HAMP domain-containing histidine kinase [Catenulispora pinistramenti]
MRNPLRSLSVRMAVLAAVAVTVASGSIGLAIHQSTKSRQLYYGRVTARGDLAEVIGSDRTDQQVPASLVPPKLAAEALTTTSPVTFYDSSFSLQPVMWAAQYVDGKLVVAQYPMASEQRDLEALDRHTLYAAAGTVAVLVPLAAFGAEFAGRRLRRAARTAHRIAAGDLDARIGPRGRAGDEVHDISRAVDSMADALQRRLRAEQRFTADVAHELRTPLAGLVAATELLPDGEATELVRDRVRVLRSLTENLLEVSRLDAQVETADFVAVPLPEFVSETVAGIGFDVRLSVEGYPVVRTDPRRLDRILTNLLLNADKHGRAPIELGISGLTLTVRDHGPGFPPDILAEGPSRFRTGAPERGRGHGLGLTIALGQARVIGAGLEFGDAVDGGAIARVRLPPIPDSALDTDAAGHLTPLDT